jgi:replication fork clamp-binding protein CrfC
LAKKLKFIKEVEFSKKKGAVALKLIGDVIPIDKVEVVKRVKENLLKEYPLTAMEIIDEVKKRLSDCKQGDIYRAISETGLKNNMDYSVYNFRSKMHEDKYKTTGKLPSGTPSIYKQSTIDYIVQVLKNEKLKTAPNS